MERFKSSAGRGLWLATSAAAVLALAIGERSVTPSSPTASPQLASAQNVGGIGERLARLPLQFEHHGDRYLARGAGYALAVDGRSATLRLRGPDEQLHDLDLRLRAATTSLPAAEQPLKARANYLLGSDPSQWRTQLPTYGQLRQRAVYPGIDAIYYGRDRQLEYDFEVAPNADPGRIVIDIRGAQAAQLDDAGDLQLTLAGETLTQHRPFAYQLGADGRAEPVAAGYVLETTDQGYALRFELGDYDRSRKLVIDPVLRYSTYLGGVAGDDLYAVTTVADGVIVAGIGGCQTSSGGPFSFPVTEGAFDTLCRGNQEAFVAKLDDELGELLFSTYIGGNSDDAAYALTTDADGNIIVGGTTRADGASGFPVTTGAYQTTGKYVGDAFIAKLDPTGSQLLYGTLFGGAGAQDIVYGIAVDAAGDIVFAGQADNRFGASFPVTEGAYDTSANGDYDGFVAKLRPAGAGAADLIWSTLIGGTEKEEIRALALGSEGIYLAGWSALDFSSPDRRAFPTTPNGYDTTTNGDSDAFFSLLSLDGSTLKYSTLLGGSGPDRAQALAVDAQGRAYVGGYASRLAGFPTTPGAYDPNRDPASTQGFVLKIDPALSGSASLVWSTLIGGSGEESVEALAVRADGSVYAAGYSSHFGERAFPTTPGSLQAASRSDASTSSDARDGFVSVFSADGSRLLYSTLLGSGFEDIARTLAFANDGSVVVAGRTFGRGFWTSPQGGEYQSQPTGGTDGFVTRLNAIADSSAQFTSARFTTPGGSGTRATISVSRSGSSAGAFSVNYGSTAGTAHPGGDYRTSGGTLEWLDGESGTKTYEVQILSGGGGRTVNLTLGSPSGVLGEPNKAILQIGDAPSPGTLSFDPSEYSIGEGDGEAIVTITRTGGSAGEVSARVITVDGSATAGEDYTPVDTIVLFEDGDVEPKTVRVPIIDDALVEDQESVRVRMSDVVGAEVDEDQADVYIHDNDEPPVPGTLQFAVSSVEVGENVGMLGIEVMRSGGSDGAVSALVRTRNGSARSGSDYLPLETRVNFADGDAATKTVFVNITDDALDEDEEQFELTLTGADGGANIGELDLMRVNIVDNDDPPALSFAQATSIASEADGIVHVIARLSAPSGRAIYALYSLAGTAELGVDYGLASDRVYFAPGATEHAIDIALVDDTRVEPDETLIFSLQTPENATLGEQRTHTLTITSDDSLRAGSLHFASELLRVDESAGTVSIGITRSEGSESAVGVRLRSFDGTARAGSDYEAVDTVVSFADGEAGTKNITLRILDDSLNEPTESFGLSLSEASGGAAIGAPSSIVVGIIDDDAPPSPGKLQFALADYRVNENAGNAAITVTRTDGSAGAVSASFSTAAISATAGADYQEVTTQVSFADGDTTPKTVLVPIVDDNVDEPDETVSLRLSAPTGGATLGLAEARLTIGDDDAPYRPGSIALSAIDYAIAENAGSVQISLLRSDGGDGVASVRLVTADESASSPADYAATDTLVQWADGDVAPKTVTIAIADDTLVEGAERFVIALSQPTGAGLGEIASGHVTIVDDDLAPQPTPGALRFDTASASVDEAAGRIVLRVNRVGGSDGAVRVRYATQNGSASAGSDFEAASGVLNWAAGDSASKTIAINIADDGLAEGNEQFTLTLSAPEGGAMIGTPGSIMVTIVDDDRSELEGKSGGGAFGGGLIALLGLAALLRRSHKAAQTMMLATLLALLPMLANAADAALESPRWYAGVRGGPAHIDISDALLRDQLASAGYDAQVKTDHQDAYGAIYAGWWLMPNYAIEFAAYDLGEYSTRISSASPDAQGIANAIVDELPGASRGVSLSLRPLIPLKSRLFLDVRGGLGYGWQKAVVEGEGLRVSRRDHGFGANGSIGLLAGFGKLRIGFGAEAYVPGQGSSFYPLYGSIEYGF
jgi:hypothetical protein